MREAIGLHGTEPAVCHSKLAEVPHLGFTTLAGVLASPRGEACLADHRGPARGEPKEQLRRPRFSTPFVPARQSSWISGGTAMQDFVSFLPIAVVLGAIASAVHARYRLDHQRDHLFHRQQELKQTIQDIELGLELADRRREEEMRILEQTPSPAGPQLLALRDSQLQGLPRRITNAHVAMLLQEIKQTVSNDAQGVNQNIMAETRMAAIWTFLQNAVFFLLGTMTSVLISKYF
jgi:hypothetical protein